jgi:hypothetical protein
MPVVERYQTDYLAIFVTIVSVLIVIFLGISAVYFKDVINLGRPTNGFSEFLFWTAIIMIAIFVFIGVYAFYRLLTWKVVIYEETPLINRPLAVQPVLAVQPMAASQPMMLAPAPAPAPAPAIPLTGPPTRQLAPAPIGQSATQYVAISNVPPVRQPSNVSSSASDLPITQRQRSVLSQELAVVANP